MGFDNLYEMRWRNDVSSLANGARFGLRYLSRTDKKDEAPKFLREGVKLCSILVKAAEVGQKEKISSKELDYCTVSKPLIKANEDLSEMEKDATKVLNLLELALGGENVLDGDVAYANSFFVKISEIYQREVWGIFNQLIN